MSEEIQSSFNYDAYSAKCNEIRKQNEQLLKQFKESLSGLSEKTIRNHYINIDFFLNEFLLYYDIGTYKEGVYQIDMFFDFFNRKCLWSSPDSIKNNCASLKKFYKWLFENGKISKEDLEFIKTEIKENQFYWILDSQ